MAPADRRAILGGMRPRPFLLIIAATLLFLVQLLHFLDVLEITPGTFLGGVTLLARANITPLAWLCYVVGLCGLLTVLDRRSWLSRYRNRFAALWLWSVPAWCYFDWQNFYFLRDQHTGLRAWEYINMPQNFGDRILGYLVAFGAIAPGMFLSAEVLMRLGFCSSADRVNGALFGRRTLVAYPEGMSCQTRRPSVSAQ